VVAPPRAATTPRIPAYRQRQSSWLPHLQDGFVQEENGAVGRRRTARASRRHGPPEGRPGLAITPRACAAWPASCAPSRA
jgi:hypothetical protein